MEVHISRLYGLASTAMKLSAPILVRGKKVKNIQQDDRVSLRMETGGKTGTLGKLPSNFRTRQDYGRWCAPIAAPASAGIFGTGSDFPPGSSPPGDITHIQVEHVHGHGPWRTPTLISHPRVAIFSQAPSILQVLQHAQTQPVPHPGCSERSSEDEHQLCADSMPE